jgi:hypothetical protein
MRNGVALPAKTSDGGSSSGVMPFRLSIPAIPVTDIKASNPETIRNNRLFPVLTAENPSRSVMAI